MVHTASTANSRVKCTHINSHTSTNTHRLTQLWRPNIRMCMHSAHVRTQTGTILISFVRTTNTHTSVCTRTHTFARACYKVTTKHRISNGFIYTSIHPSIHIFTAWNGIWQNKAHAHSATTPKRRKERERKRERKKGEIRKTGLLSLCERENIDFCHWVS